MSASFKCVFRVWKGMEEWREMWMGKRTTSLISTGKNVKAWQESRTTGKQAEKIKHSVRATCWLMDSLALASATDQNQVTGKSYSWASVHTAVKSPDKFLHPAEVSIPFNFSLWESHVLVHVCRRGCGVWPELFRWGNLWWCHSHIFPHLIRFIQLGLILFSG